MPSQEERKFATKAAIIDAAKQCFGKSGFEATTMEDIAAEAGVAKGAAYHYFSNKKAVFELVFEEMSKDALQTVYQTIKNEEEVLNAILTGTRAFFMICAVPEASRILLSDSPMVLGWQRWKEIDTQNFGGVIANALSDAVANRVIRPVPVDKIATLLIGGMQEAALDCLAQEDFTASAEEYLTGIEVLLDGLRMSN